MKCNKKHIPIEWDELGGRCGCPLCEEIDTNQHKRETEVLGICRIPARIRYWLRQRRYSKNPFGLLEAAMKE